MKLDQYEFHPTPTNDNLLNFCLVLTNSWRVGDPEKPQVLFGELFDDEQTQQHYEGLAATLKAAKKRGIVTYKSPILLKGAHDKVMVNLVDTSPQQGGSSELTMETSFYHTLIEDNTHPHLVLIAQLLSGTYCII